jgi:hypothetical protein
VIVICVERNDVEKASGRERSDMETDMKVVWKKRKRTTGTVLVGEVYMFAIEMRDEQQGQSHHQPWESSPPV